MTPHVHPLRIYYEDTDFSGVVYHANYLKFMERAREHVLGVDELVRMYQETGVGFVVYKAEMTFREGAVFGDRLEVRTSIESESSYRLVFRQDIYRVPDDALMVEGLIHLVCVNADRQLVKLPETVISGLRDAQRATD